MKINYILTIVLISSIFISEGDTRFWRPPRRSNLYKAIHMRNQADSLMVLVNYYKSVADSIYQESCKLSRSNLTPINGVCF